MFFIFLLILLYFFFFSNIFDYFLLKSQWYFFDYVFISLYYAEKLGWKFKVVLSWWFWDLIYLIYIFTIIICLISVFSSHSIKIYLVLHFKIKKQVFKVLQKIKVSFLFLLLFFVSYYLAITSKSTSQIHLLK